MGKTGKWLRSFLTGKKDHKEREKEKGTTAASNHNQNCLIPSQNGITPAPITPATPKEKRRWSFRRSSATAPASTPRDSTNSAEPPPPPPAAVGAVESEDEKKKHAMTVAAATAAAADAATAAVIRLTAAVEETAVTKIQAYFRAYLARKALRALRGLVKLQALVRGHLVRKQATATLRCMQALITLQAQARAQRLRMVEETNPANPRLSTHRNSNQANRIKNTYHENDKALEENIKIVEMDIGETKGDAKSRSSYSNYSNHGYSKQENNQYSPAPSAITDMSPRAYSGHFENYNSFVTAQSAPNCYHSSSASKLNDPSKLQFTFPRQDYYADSLSSYDYPLFPNYMANTESSRAKARSQSAPKQRPPELYERQSSGRRRASMEGARHNNVPRAVRMQRSSSHVGSAAKDYQYPWMAIKLDRSNVSLKDSECGSTSTILTNTYYCRSLVSYDASKDLTTLRK